MTTEQIFDALKELAPAIVFEVTIAESEDDTWIGEPEHNPRIRGKSHYHVNFSATCIMGGEYIHGKAGFYGWWAKPDDVKKDDYWGKVIPLLCGAAADLRSELCRTGNPLTHAQQLASVGEFLEQERERRYG